MRTITEANTINGIKLIAIIIFWMVDDKKIVFFCLSLIIPRKIFLMFCLDWNVREIMSPGLKAVQANTNCEWISYFCHLVFCSLKIRAPSSELRAPDLRNLSRDEIGNYFIVYCISHTNISNWNRILTYVNEIRNIFTNFLFLFSCFSSSFNVSKKRIRTSHCIEYENQRNIITIKLYLSDPIHKDRRLFSILHRETCTIAFFQK